jgi:catechol 2,3-dioxygenase-like lactoylglutathione lyase family enzyme
MAFGIRVKDFNKAFDFYTKTLGLTAKTTDMENKFAEVSLGNFVLALLTDETLDGMCGKETYVNSEGNDFVIAFEVDNLENTYKELKDKGVDFIKDPKTTPWGQKVAYFRDPEGYIWELSEPFSE